MKHSSKYLSMALAAVLLTGCSAPAVQNSSQSAETPADVQTDATEAIAEEATEKERPQVEQKTLPVLSITTKSTDPDVMKFVTEPVAEHVAEAIASWTPGYKIPVAPYYEECTVTLTDADGTSLLADADAQVKVRGNWTTVYEKKPLRIKFTDKTNMLGLCDGADQRNWLLLAEYKDGSMLRNKAAFSAAKEILGADGLYSTDSEFVTVEINGEYYGVYLLTDMQQVSSHRVDITEPEPEYTGTDIGYFLEFDGYFYNEDELHGFHVDYADNAALIPYDGNDGTGNKIKCLPSSIIDPKDDVGFTIKSQINSQEQHDFIENFVNNTYRIMYEAAYNDKAFVFDDDYSSISETSDITPQEAVEKVVNVDSLADTYIISDLTCDADIYWSSFYMDVDFGENGDRKLTFEAPWDFDSSMGNKDRCINGAGFYACSIVPDVNGNVYKTCNPWLVVLAYEDWYQDIIKEKWTRAYDGGVFDRAIELVENDSAALQDEFTKNYDKWDNIKHNEDFVNELSEPAAACKTEQEAADFLADWLRKRVDWLNTKWHK